jgi:hypothetical protein
VPLKSPQLGRRSDREFGQVRVVGLVPEAEAASFFVECFDVGLENGSLNTPLAAGANLDGGKLSAAYQRVDLGGRDIQKLCCVGKCEKAAECGGGFSLVHVVDYERAGKPKTGVWITLPESSRRK